jgi:hypothetical protein
MTELRPHYFHIGGLTLQVEADLPISPETFHELFERFRVPGPGPDTVCLRHHFSLPELPYAELGRPVCVQPPWVVYRWDGRWVYLCLAQAGHAACADKVGIFNERHTLGDIYHPAAGNFLSANLLDLSQAPGDENLLAQLLPERDGCLLQAAGLALEEQGLACLSHSECGRPTFLEQVCADGELLCSERLIIRRWPAGYRMHGTWFQQAGGEAVSASYPLSAILLLEQGASNRLARLKPAQAAQLLSLSAVKPLLAREYWLGTLDLLSDLAHYVPVYRLRFDLSGGVRYLLRDMLRGNTRAL